ncbi:MAG: hypothetical protein H7X89_07120 [Rhizobiales bacterium]|nr:hypothetical protein [Hyphomicrobiales bacterium]
MKFSFSLLLVGLTFSAAHAECPLYKISQALVAPIGGMTAINRDVTNIQSTEGGEWRIFRYENGRLNTILLKIYGETGNWEMRLSLINNATYGIASTHNSYNHHIAGKDPFAIVRQSTEYYFYCDGKLYLPDRNDEMANSMIDWQTYSKDGEEAKTMMLNDTDVADFIKDLVK